MALDTGRSGREDKREESRRVVGPTRDDGEDVHQHGTSGDCCESQVTKPDQLTDTHDDQWEREESAQDHLSGEEPQIVTGRRVLRSKHSRHGQGGRPVRELPHHIGYPQHDSRTQAQPGPSGGENRACPGDQQAEGKGDQQKEDQVLVLEAEAGHRSGAHPASGAFLDDGPEGQPERERPGSQVVDRGPGQGCAEPRVTGAHAMAMAASIYAKRLPPSEAVVSPVPTTTAPPARAGSTRTALGLAPKSPIPRRVNHGARGGWST